MKVDAQLPTDRGAEAGDYARAAEAVGFDGLWAAETSHDPFLALALAAAATSRIELGTAVAIAFARSPAVLAQTAWNLAALSGGRFVLGLGTQVRAHVERRFAMPWGPPVGRMREYVGLVRAIWRSWREGERLNFRGQHYSATLMTPFFSPPPLAHADPPIHLAAVAPPLLRLAGEVADGLAVHPLHTRAYLMEVIRPSLAEGARRAGRDACACALSVPVFAITGRDADARSRAREQARAQIAFYASTPSYRPVLAHHGLGDLQAELAGLAAGRRWDEMAGLVPDTLLREVAVEAEPGELGAAVRARYDGLADRITLSRRFAPGEDDRFWRETLRELRR